MPKRAPKPPLAPSVDGRDKNGRFTSNNNHGRGNPFAKQAAQLRSALMGAITPEAIERVIAALIAQAESGNVQAIKEVLDRGVGRPLEFDIIERLEQLEAQFNEQKGKTK